MTSSKGPSAGGQRSTPAERQERIERVAELINKYNLTYKAVAERMGISYRIVIDDAAIARKQGLLKPR